MSVQITVPCPSLHDLPQLLLQQLQFGTLSPCGLTLLLSLDGLICV